MKKKILSILLAGAMGATLLAGCGSNSSTDTGKTDTEKTETASGPEAITLTVMTPSEDQDDANGNWAKTECEKFAEANKDKWDITFEYVQASEADAKDTVLQDPASAADVYMYANDQITDLVKAGALAKLGGDAAEAVKSSNSESVVATVSYEGDIYGVPYTSNTWFMYYDNRVFSEDDVKSLDTMLQKGKVSFPLDNGWYLEAFYTANGCTFYGDGSQEDAGIDFASEKATPVTKYLVDLMKNPNFVADSNDGSVGLAGLADGSINAYFNGNWNYDAVVEALGGEENVGCAALPTFNCDGKDVQMKAFLGSKALGVNPNSKNQAAAVALATFLGSEDAQLDHFTMRAQAPVATSLASNADVTANKACAALAAVAANTSTAQPIFGMQGYWDAATPFGDAIINGDVTADNAEEKTQEFADQINGSLVQ